MTLEELKERYFQFLFELGAEHPDTIKAKKAYFEYCKTHNEE